MSLDMLLLVAGGIVAVGAGGLVAFVSPGRLVSLLAAFALALLGLLQFGFARAVYSAGAAAGVAWFENSLALGLAVSALWVLLSATLGRTQASRGLGGWRIYLALQAALCMGALAYVALRPFTADAIALDAAAFPLRTAGRWMLAGLLLNLVLQAANFEAAHLALPRRYQRAFRPGILGVMVYSGFFTYLFAGSLVSGRVSVADLSVGAVPITVLSLLLPLSLVRGRVGLARISRDRPRVGATTSLLIACGFLIGTAALLAATSRAGVSLGRGLWLLAAIGLVAGIAALALSNRLRRRLQRMLDPIWYDARAPRRALAAKAVAPLERAPSLDALARLIPSNARELAGVTPVTLFLAENGPGAFRAVASTMVPGPNAVVGSREPLAVELRRAGRPIRLRGRADDLEYVSIYVENGQQIEACAALCAVPLFGEEELIGFLLCGSRGGEPRVRRDSLHLLHLAARRYAVCLERFLHNPEPGGPSAFGEIANV